MNHVSIPPQVTQYRNHSCVHTNTAKTLPFRLTPFAGYLLNVVVLWQPELSQEFGAPLLPLWPEGLVTIPPTQLMPRSWQVLQLPAVTTPLWIILVPLKVVVDL